MATGASSVWALAEQALGVPIDWARVADPSALAERLLGQPMEALFDPANIDSPIYAPERRRHRARRFLAERLGAMVGLPTVRSLAETIWVDRGDFGTPHWHDLLQPASAGGCYLYAPLVALLFRGHPLNHTAVPPIGFPGDGKIHCHHFKFHRGGLIDVYVDDRVRDRIDLLGSPVSIGAMSRKGDWWPAIWAKAYGALLRTQNHELPHLGEADLSLQALTGAMPGAVRTVEELLRLPAGTDGVFEDAVVVDTLNPSRWTPVQTKGDAGWHVRHSYAALGTICDAKGDAVFVVYDPVGRRDIGRLSSMAWDALDASARWHSYGRAARGESGVLPIPVAAFREFFQIAWRCPVPTTGGASRTSSATDCP